MKTAVLVGVVLGRSKSRNRNSRSSKSLRTKSKVGTLKKTERPLMGEYVLLQKLSTISLSVL